MSDVYESSGPGTAVVRRHNAQLRSRRMTTVAEILGSMRGRIEREIGKENAARIIAGVRAGIVRETGPMVVPELVREAEKICDDAGVKDPLIRQRLIASFEKYFRNEWDARANPTRRLR